MTVATIPEIQIVADYDMTRQATDLVVVLSLSDAECAARALPPDVLLDAVRDALRPAVTALLQGETDE